MSWLGGFTIYSEKQNTLSSQFEGVFLIIQTQKCVIYPKLFPPESGTKLCPPLAFRAWYSRPLLFLSKNSLNHCRKLMDTASFFLISCSVGMYWRAESGIHYLILVLISSQQRFLISLALLSSANKCSNAILSVISFYLYPPGSELT